MKTFPLGTVLTVTTGRLLTTASGKDGDNGIGSLYEILGHMTDDSPYTTQLGRFSDECKPWLLRWFPELAEASNHLEESSGANSLDYAIKCVKASGNDVKHAISNWLELCIADWGMKREYEIGKIPKDDHVIKNVYDELVENRGTDEGIIIAG